MLTAIQPSADGYTYTGSAGNTVSASPVIVTDKTFHVMPDGRRVSTVGAVEVKGGTCHDTAVYADGGGCSRAAMGVYRSADGMPIMMLPSKTKWYRDDAGNFLDTISVTFVDAPPPVFDKVAPVKDASFTVLPNGNYRCVVSNDSSVRFSWALASLRGGRNYRLSFDVVSVTNGGVAVADWCDGNDGMIGTVPPTTLPIGTVGPRSFIVSRPAYDATYRFLDIGNDLGEEDGWVQLTITITPPILVPA